MLVFANRKLCCLLGQKSGENMNKLSLRIQILLPVIVLVVVGMIAVIFTAMRTTSGLIEKNIIEHLEETTQGIATQIGNWVVDMKIDLRVFSDSRVFSDILAYQNASNGAYVQRANSALAEYVERYDYYDEIVLFDKEGLSVAASVPAIIGKINIKEDPSFQKNLQGEQTIKRVMKSVSTGRPIFIIASPVMVNGKVAGSLAAAVSLSRFSEESISTIKVGQQGYVYLTDSNGLVIAHKFPEHILKTNIRNFDWGNKVLEKKQGIINYHTNGDDKLTVYRTEPITGWFIGAEALTKDLFGPLRKVQIKTDIIALIVVIIMILVIVWTIRPVIAALVRGVDFAREIQGGDLTNRLCFNRGDEIGRLGEALDSMADSLQQRAELAVAIAAGDLTQDVVLNSEKDVLGRGLKTMSERLNEILEQIKLASEQIDAGSNQVSDSAQDLSQGATQQASAIEEIGASLNELSGQTRGNAENAATANQLAAAARTAAHDGSSQMQQMVAAMREINESGQNIGKIIKTIDEIAFQTNLLALNAAVEAARAGQHGKGFAVVAEEVRNLAARSAKAAQETADLIEGSIAKGVNGTNIANGTATALEEIVSAIGKTSDLIAEIAVSSQEQADGLAQVNNGIGQIDQVTQRNTAGAEESAAAAEQLSSQSSYLRQLIGQFKLKDQRQYGETSMAGLEILQTGSISVKNPRSEFGTDVGNWGQIPVKPRPVIALNDGEFGRY